MKIEIDEKELAFITKLIGQTPTDVHKNIYAECKADPSTGTRKVIAGYDSFNINQEGLYDKFTSLLLGPKAKYKVLYVNLRDEYVVSEYYYKSKEDFESQCSMATFVQLIEHSKISNESITISNE